MTPKTERFLLQLFFCDYRDGIVNFRLPRRFLGYQIEIIILAIPQKKTQFYRFIYGNMNLFLVTNTPIG